MSGETQRDRSSPIPDHAAEATTGVTRRAAVVAGAALAAASVSQAAAADQPQEEVRRGSEKLLSATLPQAGGITQDQVDQLIKLLGRDTIKLVDWHILGIPNPEVITAVAHTSPQVAGELMSQVFAARLRANILVFPNGIPPVIDGTRVEVVLRG